MRYVIGIDVGTTSTKSILLDERGRVVDFQSESYLIQYPQEGWAVQDPNDWWKAIVKTVRSLVDRHKKISENIYSLSLSSQGGSLVLLDRDFNPICDSVSWLDTRAKDISSQLEEFITTSEIYKLTGWPILNSLCFPNIFWFKKNKQEIYKKTQYFASTIDFINKKLTGRFAIDLTNLAMMLLIDIMEQNYSKRVLDILELTEASFPEIVLSGDIIGTLQKKAAEELGLSETVRVISGAHDQYCANIGTGSLHSGDCTLSSGTAWVFNAVAEKFIFVDEIKSGQGMIGCVFPGVHIVREKKGLMTTAPFGGNSLTWFKEVLQPNVSFKELDARACEIGIGSGGLNFIPIMGSSSGKGAFLNIDGSHTLGNFVRSIYEGVAFINKINFEVYDSVGLEIKRLSMIGGGVKSNIWPVIVSNVCNLPVRIPLVKEAPCFGAGILAALGSGIYHSVSDVIDSFVRFERTIEPDKKRVETYIDLFYSFKNLAEKI